MSLKDVDLENAFRRLADRRIEEAMREGKFDNLPGRGQPLELEPMPAEENARMTWWCLRILKHNDFTPEEVRYRKAIEHLRTALERALDEAQLCRLVGQINDLVRKVNSLGTNAINLGIVAVEEEEELRRFRGRKAASQQVPGHRNPRIVSVAVSRSKNRAVSKMSVRLRGTSDRSAMAPLDASPGS